VPPALMRINTDPRPKGQATAPPQSPTESEASTDRSVAEIRQRLRAAEHQAQRAEAQRQEHVAEVAERAKAREADLEEQLRASRDLAAQLGEQLRASREAAQHLEEQLRASQAAAEQLGEQLRVSQAAAELREAELDAAERRRFEELSVELAQVCDDRVLTAQDFRQLHDKFDRLHRRIGPLLAQRPHADHVLE